MNGLATVAVAACASPFNAFEPTGPANTPATPTIEQGVILIGDAGTSESAGLLQVMADSGVSR